MSNIVRIVASDAKRRCAFEHGYEEFRFFTGMRPSGEIALEVGDCDLRQIIKGP